MAPHLARHLAGHRAGGRGRVRRRRRRAGGHDHPGVTHGGISLYCEELEAVFTGKTLLADGPGKLGGDYPALADQLSTIGGRLFTLAHRTRVLPAHGEETVIGELEPKFDAWLSGGLTRGAGEPEEEGPLTDGTRAARIRLNPDGD
nr:hypothetical protein GCM10020093_059910 [Planobispora longispora]